MKIALISTDNPYVKKTIGGKHVHLLLLERGLKKHGNTVSTFFYKNNILQKIFLAFRHPSVLWNQGNRRIFITEKQKKYFSGIDFSDFDIVNAHDIVSALGANTEKLVLTLHGYFTYETINYGNYNEKEKQLLIDVFKKMEREAVFKSNRIITVDTRIKNYLESEFSIPSEKVSVIYNAVDTDKFHPVSEDKKHILRSKLNIGENKFVVLIPRRYVRKNGVLYAALAAKSLKDSNVLMIFIGRGPLKEELEKIVDDNSKARVLDAVPYNLVDEYYKVSDAILIPSITSDNVEEATSLSLLEGMACEKIVLCTPIGGMKEVVKDGENGFFVRQKSEKDIIEKINHIKQNYSALRYVAINAREYVIENHSYIEHSEKFMDVYRKTND